MRVLHVGDDFAALRPCGLTLYSDALMQGQVAAGHKVSYVCSGRQYPRLQRPRLKRRRDRDVAMFELVGSPNHSHWEDGTRTPLLDVAEPAGEAAFRAAMRESRPDVVHIHELAGLPSSVIPIARESGVPVVMTLHDYKSLCASVRLLDADGRRCYRHEVGEDCARNCAAAPAGRQHLVDWTIDYEIRRAKRVLPLGERIDFSALAPAAGALRGLVSGPPAGNGASAAEAPAAAPADYQRRRDVNLERLGLCNRLLAPSARVAEIYAGLGVDRALIDVQRLTLPHLEALAPRRDAGVGSPLTFVTLGGCASPAKGSQAIVDAVRALEAAGDRYRLVVHGNADDAAREALGSVPSVELAGPYAPGDLDRLLERADVGILPSIWEEAHGFVGIEMLAKGLPVIGSALGGIPEYVRDGETGWLNRSATGSELAELMSGLIAAPRDAERLRRLVRDRRAEIVRPMEDHLAEVSTLYQDVARA